MFLERSETILEKCHRWRYAFYVCLLKMYSHLKFEQSRHACRGRNEILIQVLIVVLTLLPWIPQTEASVGTVTKVQREENGSNIFQVNIVTCDVDACKSRNASLLGNEASGLDCRCRCEKEGVYSFHEDKCLSGGKGRSTTRRVHPGMRGEGKQ